MYYGAGACAKATRRGNDPFILIQRVAKPDSIPQNICSDDQVKVAAY